MLLMPWDGEENAFRCRGVLWAGSGLLLVLPQAGYFGRLLQMPSSPPFSPPAIHGWLSLSACAVSTLWCSSAFPHRLPPMAQQGGTCLTSKTRLPQMLSPSPPPADGDSLLPLPLTAPPQAGPPEALDAAR